MSKSEIEIEWESQIPTLFYNWIIYEKSRAKQKMYVLFLERIFFAFSTHVFFVICRTYDRLALEI